MNQRNAILAILAVILLPVLFQIGYWAAADSVMAGIAALALISALAVFALGLRIWILIPAFYGLNTALRVVPGSVSMRDMVVVGVCSIMLLQLASRKVRLRLKFDTPTVCLSILLLLVVQAYVRNPVGVASLGSASVGGKPYFEMALAFAAYAMLSSRIVPSAHALKIGAITVVSSLGMAVFQTASFMIPIIGDEVTKVFAFMGTGFQPGVGDTGTSLYGRRGYLRDLVPPSVSYILAKVSPLEILLRFRFPYMIAAGALVVVALYSGYRSLIVWSALMTAAAFLVRRDWFGAVFLTAGFVTALALILPLQGHVLSLPQPAQRALSFLPAQWDGDVKANADASIEWRLEMWHEVLTTDRYIADKVFGDGFGLSARELQLQLNMFTRGWMTDQEHQEYYMMTGGYHSGPIESVRRVGYVGAGFLILVQLLLARYAWQLIRRWQNTPLFFSAMVVGLPIVVHPFDFCIVFGTFKDSVILLCFGCSFLRLMENAAEAEQLATERTPAALRRSPIPVMS